MELSDKHTLEVLNNCNHKKLITLVLMLQKQLNFIDDQLSFFNKTKNCCVLFIPESVAEEVLSSKHNRKKGKRKTDLRSFPEEVIPPYHMTTEEWDTSYGAG